MPDSISALSLPVAHREQLPEGQSQATGLTSATSPSGQSDTVDIESNTGTSAQTVGASDTLQRERLHKLIEELSKSVRQQQLQYRFEIHEESHRFIVKVVDSQRNEVIQEIPPEKILDMLSEGASLAGLVIDAKA